jgi:hypothetical protein
MGAVQWALHDFMPSLLILLQEWRRNWAAALFARTSARWSVAASTRISTSVQTLWVLSFAIAVTLVLDVPALLVETDGAPTSTKSEDGK